MVVIEVLSEHVFIFIFVQFTLDWTIFFQDCSLKMLIQHKGILADMTDDVVSDQTSQETNP